MALFEFHFISLWSENISLFTCVVFHNGVDLPCEYEIRVLDIFFRNLKFSYTRK